MLRRLGKRSVSYSSIENVSSRPFEALNHPMDKEGPDLADGLSPRMRGCSRIPTVSNDTFFSWPLGTEDESKLLKQLLNDDLEETVDSVDSDELMNLEKCIVLTVGLVGWLVSLRRHPASDVAEHRRTKGPELFGSSLALRLGDQIRMLRSEYMVLNVAYCG